MRPHTRSAIDQGFQVAKRVLEADVWMVRYLGNVIGPVSLELVEKGIEAGKLPVGTEIAHWERQEWRRLRELYPQLASRHAEVAPPADAPVAPEIEERRSSLPPPAISPRTTRATFSARPYSSPPPRPVPVPASAPPPLAPAMVETPVIPQPDVLPVVPPPPPVPPAPPPSYRFPEEPVSIPKQGVLAAIFG